jgi:hypothetical protein
MLARTKEAFIQEANDLADSNKRSAAAIQKKLSDLEIEKSKLDSSLHAASLALKRAADYPSIFGSDLPCPRCWIGQRNA